MLILVYNWYYILRYYKLIYYILLYIIYKIFIENIENILSYINVILFIYLKLI